MTLKKSLVAALVSTALCLPAVAQDLGSFSKRIYAGVAGGTSTLSPESQVEAYTIDDKSDSGGKFMLGMDISPRVGVELAAADLGAAGIGPNEVGEIEYSVFELSGLYHFFNLGGYEALVDRRGLGAFFKLGLGVMDNDSELEYTRENDLHLSGGVGLEYGLRMGLALRGEVEAFDEDAMLTSLGLLWRFGGGSSSPSTNDLFTSGAGAVGAMVDKVGDAMPSLENDDDGDGVPNNLDDCQGTAAGTPVAATGCALFGGVLEGVNFASGSDRLLDEAQVVLNDAADALLADPGLKVEVQAHTDSQGAADYNIQLSKDRALATVRYLMLRGVPQEQMTARAFGESTPIADNATADGRKRNRRVEFHVIE